MATLIPGFKLADGVQQPRMIIAVDGLDKSGKSNFAFTAPGPIAYLPFDVGAEGVIEKFQTKKQIFVPKESYETRFENGKAKAEATSEFARFRTDYSNAIKAARSAIVDTATETWELLRLARFGKLSQIKPHHYTEVNQEFRDLVREAFDSTSNLILLHKVKAVWKDGPTAESRASKTGEMERAGFSETGYLVQINVLCYRLEAEERAEGDLGFRMKILNCRQNPEIQGMVLENEQISIQTLGSLALPEFDPSVWE
jgi:hypothetical protein